ncbi:MAG: hypothetical protein IJ708_03635 [Clostridia bacterium]|nr:hypothetical protein [Clostridia bacterium]
MQKLFFGEGAPSRNRIYFWNLASSMVYSLQSAILLLVITRAGGLFAAGTFSAVYAITQTLTSLGSYSMRNYQVSDIRDEYSFSTYFSSRVVTSLIMVLACLGYAVFHQMDLESTILTFLFSLYRFTECMEDVYHGEIEKQKRLDVVSIAVTVRVVLATLAFCLIFILTRSLIYAGLGMLLTAVLLVFLFNRLILTQFPHVHAAWHPNGVLRLLAVTFPVFIGAILYNYLVNAPKLSIFRVLDAQTQAIFNILFMPIFVINILSQFIFRPMVAQMGIWWQSGAIRELRVSIRRQILIISALTLLIVIVGYFLGCSVLGFVYGVDLSGLSLLFALLLVFGGIAALDTFFSVVLTIMRKQIYIIVGYVIGYILCFFFIDTIVSAYGLSGAGYAYGLIMTTIFIVFVIAYIVEMHSRAKTSEKVG